MNILCCLGMFLTGALHATPDTAKLDVHEWGTFTVVSGSDGLPLQWYQPRETLAELPAFVYPRRIVIEGRPGASLAMKSGAPSAGFYVRMETPVIYFYPDKPMPVTAEVTVKHFRITEWFPQYVPNGIQYATGTSTVSWSGELLPPSDAVAAKLTPPVTGTQGAHYAHAREVAGAWNFRTKTGDEAEKFIFYRGAGNALPPYRVEALRNGTVRLSHAGDGGAITAAFVLDVRADGARWGKFKTLPEMKENKGMLYMDQELNRPAVPAAQAEEELAVAMRASLIEAGLSVDEAKAMVATWRDVWFAETGTRVLALMPRDWVDSVLPLKITPAPANLTRVFVARFEVFTPDREDTLLALLNSTKQPDAASAKRLRDLQFGRFAGAALVRSLRLSESRISSRFHQLQSADLIPATAAR